MVELQKMYVDRGVTVVGITDEDLEMVGAFLDRTCHQDEDLTYRQLTSHYCLAADPDGSAFEDYLRGIERRSFPTVAVVGATGVIEYIGSANGLASTLAQVVDGTWDREASRREQQANTLAREVMYQVHDLKKGAKLDEAVAVLDRQVERADQALRTASYELQMRSGHREQTAPDDWARLERQLIDASVESMRWHSNRFHFLLDNRPASALEPFHQMARNYAFSLDLQINLSWRVYWAASQEEGMDRLLIRAAQELAESVSRQAPDNATYLDVHAHLLHAAGEVDAALEAFELAIAKARGEGRARIEAHRDAILRQVGR